MTESDDEVRANIETDRLGWYSANLAQIVAPSERERSWENSRAKWR